MSIADRLLRIKQSLPQQVTLVAVSKTKPETDLMEAYEAGQRVFGENKAQEMTAKWSSMPKDIQWHMIGHLQSNKVKYIAPYVALIHGVDRSELLDEIEKQGAKNNRIISCLLQVHIAEESTKFGWNPQELVSWATQEQLEKYPHVRIQGLMGMATFTSDEHQIKQEFASLKSVFDQLKAIHAHWDTLSMGMSQDYALAISMGSNMVRIGSSIFGERN
ncbi:MAG: YggS family pyridoxal phosphate-dependent enzyme [Flavobacteriaceae bacterium]|jgi:PLP dependent protein|nr:YggS family pyridoxal phosphate-dependent enzyme [Flavobacteriaceae bacterium]MDP4674531.1 YggS family pyridoxal phosphate-dependent enzyme [Flavobacteriaceae bacterium]MDP4754403.1 YggS family pyridoxal phosphate-dependent enzyme [Flavobacteriaceae bacterium]MDP4794358.1 YggS family pyridoxal phosphate-dependent enzyme [Flavobacteriaceae bacterium]MDP4886022.1 YggS family pyridoxal phosphate-dependent enzyme [Flavobacteriaceae bacterium]